MAPLAAQGRVVLITTLNLKGTSNVAPKSGFAFLTLGIATRVVIAHGHHPIADERRTLTPPVVATVAAAILLRLAAEWFPASATPLLGASGAVWMLGWSAWAARTLPRIVRARPASPSG